MNKKSIFFAALLVAVFNLQCLVSNAQNTPHYTPVSGLESSMNILGPVYLDGTAITSTNVEIGAFCGNECRGSAFPEDMGTGIMCPQTIYGTDGETINFKLYDHSTEIEMDVVCITTVTFQTNATIGFDSPFPISFSTPDPTYRLDSIPVDWIVTVNEDTTEVTPYTTPSNTGYIEVSEGNTVVVMPSIPVIVDSVTIIPSTTITLGSDSSWSFTMPAFNATLNIIFLDRDILYDTIDVTLNEGEDFNGHTLPGVYNDTLVFAAYDSIIHSRVSMVINSFEGGALLGSNLEGTWLSVNDSTLTDDSVMVLPMQSQKYIFLEQVHNIIPNGDFESGIADFETMYTDYGNGRYEIGAGYGVDSGYGVYMDGAITSGVVFYSGTYPLEAEHIYKFSYQIRPVNGSTPPTIQTTLGDTMFTDNPTIDSVWQTFTHQYTAVGGMETLEMIDLNTNFWGNDWYLDNISLTDITPNDHNDTITITNIHILADDTTYANICQGDTLKIGSMSYTEAGTYCIDTTYYTDSTVFSFLILTVHTKYALQLEDSVCEGGSYAYGGQILDTAGTYVDSLQSVYSCDSIVTLSLSIIPGLRLDSIPTSWTVLADNTPVLVTPYTNYDTLQGYATVCAGMTITVMPDDSLHVCGIKARRRIFVNGHECLPIGDSLLWATNNMGADSIHHNGDYYAWGETTPKTSYTADNYQCLNYVGSDTLTLLPQDDAAHVNWGDIWRMPTIEDWTYLTDTDHFSVSRPFDYHGTGVDGVVITRLEGDFKGNTIFLPAAGMYANDGVNGEVDTGAYWSSTINPDVDYADILFYVLLDTNYYCTSGFSRWAGTPIRPMLVSDSLAQLSLVPVTYAGNGGWSFTMPDESTVLRAGDSCNAPELAWSLTEDSLYYGFDSLATLPTLENPYDLAIHYGSSDSAVAAIDDSGTVTINGIGTAALYAVHYWVLGDGYSYDSAAYTLTVLPPDTLNLAVNDTTMGSVTVENPLPVNVIDLENGSYGVIPGSQVVVKATPNFGHNLIGWSDSTEVNNTCTDTVTVNSTMTLTALFERYGYTVSVAVNGLNAGSATVTYQDSTGTLLVVDIDSICTLNATPASDDFRFVGWFDGTDTVSTDSVYSFAVTETANYIALFEYLPASYLYVSHTGWTIWDNPHSGQINIAVLTLKTTDDQELFSGNTIDSSFQLPVDTLTDSTLYRLSLVFMDAYGNQSPEVSLDWLYVACDNFDGISNLVGQVTDEGVALSWTDSVLVFIYRDSTFLDTLTGNSYLDTDGTYNNSYEIRRTYGGIAVCPNDNDSLSMGCAQKVPIYVDLTLTAEPSMCGTAEFISPDTTGHYVIDSTCTVRATANETYTFTHWTLDNVEVSTDTLYTFTVIKGGALVAHFEYIPATDLYVSRTGWASWSNPHSQPTDTSYASTQVTLKSLDGQVIFTDTADTTYYLLPASGLSDSTYYLLSVTLTDTAGNSSESTCKWYHLACDHLEGFDTVFGDITTQGVTLNWVYPNVVHPATDTIDWEYLNGYVTDNGVMVDGADASWAKAGQITMGPGCKRSSNQWVGENITLEDTTFINEIEVYGFQANSDTLSTMTGLYIQIYNGNPMNGDTVIWGNADSNLMTATAFTGCYRGSDNDNTNIIRPIMSVTASGLDIQLAPGTYYIVWALSGSLLSGPSATPHAVPGIGNTGNSIQYTSSSEWAESHDDGAGTPYGFAFRLSGERIVPFVGNPIAAAILRNGEFLDTTAATTYTDTVGSGAKNYEVRVVYDGIASCPDFNTYMSMSCPQPVTLHCLVMVEANPATDGTVDGDSNYVYGDTITLTATPNPCYHLSCWTKGTDTVSTDANYIFAVTEPGNYVAHFVRNDTLQGDTTVVVCDSFAWYGTTYLNTPIVNPTHFMLTADGCDSSVTLILTVNHSNAYDTAITVCDNIDWLDTNYTTSGTYIDTLTNTATCDSVLTLNLTVNYSNTGDTANIVCDNFYWHGHNYTATGNYNDTLTNAVACDSVVTLNLTVNYSTPSDTVSTVCDSVYWHGHTYYTSGNYRDSLSTIHGCDSIVTLQLTVNYSTLGDTIATACDSMTWYGTQYTITPTEDPTHLFANGNIFGCDSTVTLHLTVNYPSAGDTTATECDYFDWYDKHLTASCDTTHMLINAGGCDSTLTLHLTVNHQNTGDTSALEYSPFSWYEHSNLAATQEVTHVFEGANLWGCDSTVTLHLRYPLYPVQWNGDTTVTYNTQPQIGLSASYVDDAGDTLNTIITFTRGSEVFTPPNYPVNAGTYTVVARPMTNAPLDSLYPATTTFTIQPAPVHVIGVTVEEVKFEDGTTNITIINAGMLEGLLGNDMVSHTVSAAYTQSTPGRNIGITLTYALTGNFLGNYILDPASEVLHTGVILENYVLDDGGISINPYGYCWGNGTLQYDLLSGEPDQYRVDFTDTAFTDMDWTFITTPGSLTINIPDGLATGDYSATIQMRNHNYPTFTSDLMSVTFHVDLPSAYVKPLFYDLIALIDTCHCMTDIQWYHRNPGASSWTMIPGANDYYYHEEGGLIGEYFVRLKMNGVETYTCPQGDIHTLLDIDPIAGNEQPMLKVYPNPMATTATVEVRYSASQAHHYTMTHELRVMNVMGVEMERRTFQGESTMIDLSDYPSGQYMVSVDGVVVRVIKK